MISLKETVALGHRTIASSHQTIGDYANALCCDDDDYAPPARDTFVCPKCSPEYGYWDPAGYFYTGFVFNRRRTYEAIFSWAWRLELSFKKLTLFKAFGWWLQVSLRGFVLWGLGEGVMKTAREKQLARWRPGLSP